MMHGQTKIKFIIVSIGAATPIPTYATHFLSTYQKPILFKLSRNVTHLNTIFKLSYLQFTQLKY